MNGPVDQSRRITLVAPRGTLVVRAPLDVPVAELMPELVAVGATGDDDAAGNGWVLCAADGKPLAPAATLADCGLPDDAVLELHSPDGTAKLSGAAGTGDRPLSVRNATVLPTRLSTIQRLRRATLALAAPSAPRPPAQATSMTLTAPPEAFTLAARPSLAVRVRDAWARSEYGRQLDERILAPRLRRCVTIAVVSPKGGVGKTFITAPARLAARLPPPRSRRRRRRQPRLRIARAPPGTRPPNVHRRATRRPAARRCSERHLARRAARTRTQRAHGRPHTDRSDTRQAVGRGRLPEPVRAHQRTRRDTRARCGTGLDAPPAREALGCADQLVLVTDAQPDTASLVWEAARWLERDAPPLVLLVNKIEHSSRLDVGALERTIPFARGLVEVPNDRAGAEQLLASRFSWDEAPRGWREPLRELAALLIADWLGLGLAR